MPQAVIGGINYDIVVAVNKSGNDISGGSGGGDASAANQVTGNNSLASIDTKTAPASVVNAANSTAAALGANAVFTGTGVDASGFSSITVSVFSDQGSATDGLSIQQSSNNTNWDLADVYTIPASTGKTFSIPVQARYVRVAYTNGATLQTVFRMSVLLHTYKPRSASIRPQDARTNDNDFDESASYGMMFNGTTWDRARGTIANGALTDISRIAAGTNTIGGVIDKPTTTGGTLTTRIISAATTNAGVAKASAGQVYGIQFTNTGAAVAYVKFYNKATSPTVGTDVTVDILAVPAGGSREMNRPLGMAFAAGIAYAITGGAADTDTTAVALNQVVGSIQYF